ncbi:MAG: acyltransferase [Lachnospiraceae bacterium]|nr:acyltransferase [Lachnospiraceae bacterium]
MKKEISERIYVISFFMTCIIAMYHCGDGRIEPINSVDYKLFDICSRAMETLAGLAMSSFFAVTGFLFFYNFDKNAYYTKVKKRIITLLIPYVIWQIIYAMPIVFSGKLSFGYIVGFIKTVFLLDGFPPNGPLWYLYAIFILAILAPAIWLIVRKKNGGLVAVFTCICAISILTSLNLEVIKNIISYGYIENIVRYFPAYLLGAYFGYHEEQIQNEERVKMWVLLILGALLMDAVVAGFFKNFAYRILPLFMLYYFPITVAVKELRIIGSSFLIYALHYFIDGYLTPHIRNIIMYITDYAWIVNIVGRVLSLIVVLVLAFIMWIVLSRICPWVLRVITGDRVKQYAKPNKKTVTIN